MITDEHIGYKYTLCEPGPAKKYALSIWYELTREYIFERSVDTEEEAKSAIVQLHKDGFI